MYLPFDSRILINGNWFDLVQKDDNGKYITTSHRLDDGEILTANPETTAYVRGILVVFEDGTSIIVPQDEKVVTSDDIKVHPYKLVGKTLPIYQLPTNSNKISQNYVNGVYFANGITVSTEKENENQYISTIGKANKDRFPEKHTPSLNPPKSDGYEIDWLEGVFDATSGEHENTNEIIISDRPYNRLNTIALVARSHGFSVSLEKLDVPPPFSDSGLYTLRVRGPLENLNIQVAPNSFTKITKTPPVKSIHHINGYIICLNTTTTKYTKVVTRDCTYYG